MSIARKYIDLKYDDEHLKIGDFLKEEKLPAVVRKYDFGCEATQTDVPRETEMFLQHTSKETFAHIRVLKFYDNEIMQTEKGAEYVLEHDTFVGDEYLMPLRFPGKIKLVRRPGSRGRYLTIKQVVADCPAFVKVEHETKAYLSSDLSQEVTVPAKTILELKKTGRDRKGMFAVFSDENNTYTFNENDSVNFTVTEKNTLYSLEEVSKMPMLPKVILFQGVSPYDLVLKDNLLRSAMCTIVEGPIEIVGYVNVEFLTCWIRDNRLKTYETLLLPEALWNKTYIQRRSLHSEEEKRNYIDRKYEHCLKSDFVPKSLFLLSLNLSEVTWLRSPELFKQQLEGNTLYEIVKIPFCDSSDEDDVYQEIREPRPPLPERASATKKKEEKDLLSETQEKKTSNTADTDNTPLSKEINETGYTTGKAQHSTKKKEQLNQSVSSEEVDSRNTRDKNYTQLELRKPARIYEKLDVYGDFLPLGYSKDIPDKSHQYIEAEQVKKVLADNQTQEDFFGYSVKEVSFCFEHCGLKSLADMCYEKKLDGFFFKGFNDWKELSLSSLDVIILKKMIFEGWRSKDDSVYAISTHM